MARSRAERIGTVFSRITSLVQGKALQEENVPLWYNIYKAFPPKYEPTFNRPISKEKIQQIFYNEDHLRAKFSKDINQKVNLRSTELTQSQIFINMYNNLLKDGVKKEEAYDKALKSYKAVSKKKKFNATQD